MKTNRIILILLFLLTAHAHAADVIWPAGVLGQQTLQSNTSYRGAGMGKTIIRFISAADGAHSVIAKKITNFELRDVTLDANGLRLDEIDGFYGNNVEIINAKRTKGDHQAIYMYQSKNVRIDNLYLRENTWGMFAGGRCENIKLTNVNGDWSGRLSALFASGSHDITIDGMSYQHSLSYPIEFRSDDNTGYNMTIRNVAVFNALIHPNDTNAANGPNTHSGGSSLPLPRWKNVLVELNYTSGDCILIDGKERSANPTRRKSSPTWTGSRWGMEIGGGLDGDGPVVRFNWWEDLNNALSATTGRNMTVTNNLIINCREPAWISVPANGAANAAIGSNVSLINSRYVFQGNGPNVVLPTIGGWTRAGRVPPGVSIPDSPPTSNPSTQPTPTPEPTVYRIQGTINIGADNTGVGTVTLSK